MTRANTPRILVIGGGHLGLYAAGRLQERLRPGEANLILVDPSSYMTYRPLLAEVAAGSVEPRHVTVPLRRALPRFHVYTGEVVALRHADRTARLRLADGEKFGIGYDHVVIGPGAVVRVQPCPGLAELGVGFTTLEEAVFLRNRILSQLALAASTPDPDVRRRALTFMVVGAGYAGVEALGELSDMSMSAIEAFNGLRRDEVRWILVEDGGRVLPEVSPELSERTAGVLRQRGVDIRLNTTVTSCVAGRIRFGAGRYADDVVETDTLVWTADTQPNPMLDVTDLPRDDLGCLIADAYLRVRGTPGAWTGGDCAAVPDLTTGQPDVFCAPTAQHAIRQARRLADNLIAEIRHERTHPPRSYRHNFRGYVAGLGRLQGVAQIYHVRLSGVPAWLLHRGYHLAMMPSDARKWRVLTDWTMNSLFPRDISALGELENPRQPLKTATRTPSLVARHG